MSYIQLGQLPVQLAATTISIMDAMSLYPMCCLTLIGIESNKVAGIVFSCCLFLAGVDR